MFCCAEMRCRRNDVCAMRKMMCRYAAMEGESSQGELFAKLQASSPSPASRSDDGEGTPPRGCFRRKPARQLPLTVTFPLVKMG